MYLEEKEILPAYISKHNSTRKKQIVLLIILNEEKEGQWHYLAVKKLSALLPGITSTHEGDFYFLNYLYSFKNRK